MRVLRTFRHGAAYTAVGIGILLVAAVGCNRATAGLPAPAQIVEAPMPSLTAEVAEGIVKAYLAALVISGKDARGLDLCFATIPPVSQLDLRGEYRPGVGKWYVRSPKGCIFVVDDFGGIVEGLPGASSSK